VETTRGNTVKAMIDQAAEKLAHAGVENSLFEAQVLLAHVLGGERALLPLRFREAVGPEEVGQFEAMLKRRIGREPLQHITGQQEFMSLTFKVDPRALIPRPETEHAVEHALERLKELQRQAEGADLPLVADIGTGSGAIAISLSWWAPPPGCQVWATDISPAALDLARENADSILGAESRRRIKFLEGSLLTPLTQQAGLTPGALDIVISNPPYIADEELADLQPEVRDFEPRLALAGGADGLGIYPDLIAQAERWLRPGGWLILEIGYTQADAVVTLLRRHLHLEGVIRDYGGRNRVVVGRKTPLAADFEGSRRDSADGRQL